MPVNIKKDLRKSRHGKYFAIVCNYQDAKQPVIKRVAYDSNSIDLF